jgi:hypothetical protein
MVWMLQHLCKMLKGGMKEMRNERLEKCASFTNQHYIKMILRIHNEMELSFQLYEEAYISISQGGSYFAY